MTLFRENRPQIIGDSVRNSRISEIDWDVSLAKVNLSGKAWLLPTAAAYSVSYSESKRSEWNLMSFSNYRRYGSESELIFETTK